MTMKTEPTATVNTRCPTCKRCDRVTLPTRLLTGWRIIPGSWAIWPRGCPECAWEPKPPRPAPCQPVPYMRVAN